MLDVEGVYNQFLSNMRLKKIRNLSEIRSA